MFTVGHTLSWKGWALGLNTGEHWAGPCYDVQTLNLSALGSGRTALETQSSNSLGPWAQQFLCCAPAACQATEDEQFASERVRLAQLTNKSGTLALAGR